MSFLLYILKSESANQSPVTANIWRWFPNDPDWMHKFQPQKKYLREGRVLPAEAWSIYTPKTHQKWHNLSNKNCKNGKNSWIFSFCYEKIAACELKITLIHQNLFKNTPKIIFCMTFCKKKKKTKNFNSAVTNSLETDRFEFSAELQTV